MVRGGWRWVAGLGLAVMVVACANAGDAGEAGDGDGSLGAQPGPQPPGSAPSMVPPGSDALTRMPSAGSAAPPPATGDEPAVTPADDGTGGDDVSMDGPQSTPPEAATVTPPAGAPCNGKAGAAGTSMRSVMNGALNRTFLVHIPASLDPNTAAPVVFVHHGFTMSGQIMLDLTGFADVADREGFIAVFPDGGGAAPWNVGTGICGVGAVVAGVEDDFAFVDKMIESVDADHCVDRERVMTTGFSMGGYFSNHIGCQHGGTKIRAIAPHSGGTYAGDCPGDPIPVMLLHGTGDALITPNCGTDARDQWLTRNGCSSEFESRQVQGGTCDWYMGCPPGGQVVMCQFNGMAHAWAGAPQGLYGSGPAFESATELVWDFFSQNL